MSKLGVAVVGLGVGFQHAKAMVTNPKTELIAVAELDEAKAHEALATLGSGAKFASFAEILADKAINLVVLASFDDLHAVDVVKALNSGKHVFVEKPMCCTANELATIKQAVSKNKELFLMSNLILRSVSVYKWLKAEIKLGNFGEIYALEGEYLYGRIHKILTGWRSEIENYSVMAGGGIHMLDLMTWLVEQYPCQLTNFKNKIVTKNTEFKPHDYASSVLEFKSGLIGRVTANFGCMHPHHHLLKVYGSKATFIYDDMGPRVFYDRSEDAKAELLNQNTLPTNKADLLTDFIDIILTNDMNERNNILTQELELMQMIVSME